MTLRGLRGHYLRQGLNPLLARRAGALKGDEQGVLLRAGEGAGAHAGEFAGDGTIESAGTSDSQHDGGVFGLPASFRGIFWTGRLAGQWRSG